MTSEWWLNDVGTKVGSYMIVKINERVAIGHSITSTLQPYVTYLHNQCGEYGDAIFHSNLKDAVTDFEKRTSLYQ